jgi:hypothetical protein
MREIRLSGSEGGGTLIGSPYPYHPILGHHQILPELAVSDNV